MATRVIDADDLDCLLANAVARGVAPGLVGAVANAGGVLWAGAHGCRAAEGSRPMTPDTIFWIASMTKLVTTLAVMQLVEAGDLSLDAPVAELLPELAQPQVLNADGTTRPARGSITLRHLLTHTAGIGYELMNPALMAARGPDGPPPSTSFKSLEGPLAHDPGAGWTYGYGIDWAGIAVERRSGKALNRYLADHIFQPLGMPDTDFAPRDPERMAATHVRGAEGGTVIVPSPAGNIEDREFHPGGAGLFGTVADYARLLRMLLNRGGLDGTRILRAETVDAMGENQVGNLVAGRLDTTNPALLLAYDPLPGQNGQWSLLGVRNPAPVAGARSAGSASWVGVAGTFFWVDRKANLCGVLAGQIFPFAHPQLVALQRQFEQAAYAIVDRTTHNW